ncbi:hypothetical protein [Candidatus Avelusimicrobium faecicola]|uniref:hypothetical protein n=1 Tax=Candidatus Avelusimicrobium faecicola TaxID=3416205 RepID=UPI003D129381
MKKILTTGLCLALASIGGAEVIQSVNFNPARFGQYGRLKVSEQANLKGGLKAKSMQVQSAGTIDLNATPSTDQGNLAYLITKLDGTLGHSHVGNDFPSTPTLEFPATCFSSLESCVTATATGTLNVKFQNGAARFQAPSSYTAAPESRIKQITTPRDRLRLDAVYANIHGKLDVSGNEGYTFRNISPKTPLRLAGNWIPLPSASRAPTGGTLEWQTRKTVKYGSKGGDTVRVLALKGGKATDDLKMCEKEVGTGRYAWVQTGADVGECTAQRGCGMVESPQCKRPCNKTYAGLKCVKYSPSGSIHFGDTYTKISSECKEVTETISVPCSSHSTCTNTAQEVTCESCGGTWNSSKCLCDCGWYQGNSCQFNARRGCVCGSHVRACR